MSDPFLHFRGPEEVPEEAPDLPEGALDEIPDPPREKLRLHDEDALYHAAMASLLESARRSFLERHASLIKRSSRHHLELWLDLHGDRPIERAVREAAAPLGIEDEGMLREAKASLRFRCLAGILNLPIHPVPEGDAIAGGVCAHARIDPETNTFRCVVPENQEQADAWHRAFGHGPACPFWKPSFDVGEDRKRTELDKLLSEGEDIWKAWREVGVLPPHDRGGSGGVI